MLHGSANDMTQVLLKDVFRPKHLYTWKPWRHLRVQNFEGFKDKMKNKQHLVET